MKKNIAIVLCAGQGSRMNMDIAKQYIKINNKEIIAYTLEKISKFDFINEIILVCPKNDINFCENNIVKKYNINKVIKIIAGGKRRQDSVLNALKSIDDKDCNVLIHDGVRPFVDEKKTKDLVNTCTKYAAAILARKTIYSIKEVNADKFINKSLNREFIWEAQTPQAFHYKLILEAYETAFSKKIEGTDDSSFVENIGFKVKVIEDIKENIKITNKFDLILAKEIFKIGDKNGKN